VLQTFRHEKATTFVILSEAKDLSFTKVFNSFEILRFAHDDRTALWFWNCILFETGTIYTEHGS
jgi:hypothetical protein